MIRRLIITKIDADYFTDITFDYTKYGLPLIQDCLADHIADNATVYYYDVDNKEENEVANTMVELCNIRTTPDRTGAGRKCTTSKSFTFDMRKGSFPLFTHRPMFLRGIFEELMLNLRGQSDSKILEAKGINVWQDNTSREFLDKCGLEHLPIGDIGPSYGFNMRHFGAKYVDCKTDYHGQGFDQLSYCLNELKCNPYSTRALIQLYDPTTVKHTPLPPCLYGYQFNYDGEFLNLTLIQRSSDVLLAGGWNVATGALLLLMFCQELKMKPGVLGWQVSNMHLYAEPENLEAIENMDWTQVKTFPHLFLREPSSGTGAKDLRITQYEFDDLTLVGYAPGKKISLKMAV
jgi:thymidylate synthase